MENKSKLQKHQEEIEKIKEEIAVEKTSEELEKSEHCESLNADAVDKELNTELDMQNDNIDAILDGKDEQDEEDEEEINLTPCIKLRKKIGDIDTIVMNLEEINIPMLENIRKTWEKNRTNKKEYIPLRVMDDFYMALVCAKISGTPYAIISKLRMDDLVRVITPVRNFLLGV